MKRGVHLRLTCFGLAMLAAMLAIGWAARTTWIEARRVNEKFSTAQVQSFQIADHFQETMLKINRWLRRYLLQGDPADWDRFVRESDELDRWIDKQADWLKNPHEREVLSKINGAYDRFIQNARTLAASVARPAQAVSTQQVEKLETEAWGLLTLGSLLSEAHREVMGGWIESTQQSLSLLQHLIFALLILLLGLGAWLGIVVYHEMIAPLRVKLVESQTIIERQEKLASLGVLAAGLAHEIRNPLTAIKARLFTQQKTLRPDSREFQDATVIGNEINRLEKIVREVLQFARPAEPTLVMVPALKILQNVRELLSASLERNGIHLELRDGVNREIRADAAQLQQVLINLVQNAAESIGRDGTVILRARETTARLGGVLRPAVVLEVEDTGKGIPPEVQKRLFDPFFTTKETGTGLGLAISARIVEKHGGVLEFQTQVNRGTTFGLVLPCTRDE